MPRASQHVDRLRLSGRSGLAVVPINFLGLLACAVPVGHDDGLPQGVQRIGPRYCKDQVLDAAQAIEDPAPAITPIDPRAAPR